MSKEIILSGKYQLNKFNFKRILKVLGWTIVAGSLSAPISLLPDIDFPVQYAFVPAIINTLLYAVLEFVQKQTKEEA